MGTLPTRGKRYDYTKTFYSKEKFGKNIYLFKCVNPKKLEELIDKCGDLILSPISPDKK